MKKTHYYLVDTSVILPGAAVSELQFNIIHEEPFVVHDLKVRLHSLYSYYRTLSFQPQIYAHVPNFQFVKVSWQIEVCEPLFNLAALLTM